MPCAAHVRTPPRRGSLCRYDAVYTFRPGCREVLDQIGSDAFCPTLIYYAAGFVRGRPLMAGSASSCYIHSFIVPLLSCGYAPAGRVVSIKRQAADLARAPQIEPHK